MVKVTVVVPLAGMPLTPHRVGTTVISALMVTSLLGAVSRSFIVMVLPESVT